MLSRAHLPVADARHHHGPACPIFFRALLISASAGGRGGQACPAGVTARPVPADRPECSAQARTTGCSWSSGSGRSCGRLEAYDRDRGWTGSPEVMGLFRSVVPRTWPEAPPGRADRAGRVGHAGRRVDYLLGRHGHRGGQADPAGGHAPSRSTPTSASRSLHRDRGHPAGLGLTLLPALLSIRLSLLAVKRTKSAVPCSMKPALLPWSIQGSGGIGVWEPRKWPGSYSRPRPTLTIHGDAGVRRPGPGRLRLHGVRLRRQHGPGRPAEGLKEGTLPLTQYFPESAANLTSTIFKFSQPVWTDPQVLAKATSRLKASSLFTTVARPAQPERADAATGGLAPALHAALGPAKALPPVPLPGLAGQGAARRLPALPQHLELHQRQRRPDGAVLQSG